MTFVFLGRGCGWASAACALTSALFLLSVSLSLCSVRAQREEQQRLHRPDRDRAVLDGRPRVQPLAADAERAPHGRGAVAQPALPPGLRPRVPRLPRGHMRRGPTGRIKPNRRLKHPASHTPHHTHPHSGSVGFKRLPAPSQPCWPR